MKKELNGKLYNLLTEQAEEEKKELFKTTGVEINDRDAFYCAVITVAHQLEQTITCMDIDEKMAVNADINIHEVG